MTRSKILMGCFSTQSNDKDNRVSKWLGNIRRLPFEEQYFYDIVKIKKEIQLTKLPVVDDDDDDDSNNIFIPLNINESKKYQLQTFRMYKSPLKFFGILKRLKLKRKIYIQPISDFPHFIESSCIFNLLNRFLKAFFFGFEVQLLPKLLVSENIHIISRINKTTKKEQLEVSSLLKLLKDVLPNDGSIMLGISWIDLYPNGGNFILGEGRSASRSAVFCFGRFEPKSQKTTDISEIDSKLIWKIIKVALHETCHVFGINHCNFYKCLMNESSSIQEAAVQPQLLCPVCLRKLQYAINFNLKERYQALIDVIKSCILENQLLYCDSWNITFIKLEQCLKYLSKTETNSTN